jgi:uracil-DNA glycosylase
VAKAIVFGDTEADGTPVSRFGDYSISSMREMNDMLAMRVEAMNLPFECGAGGLFNSHIAIVAEAPGERETALKTPLIGGSGALLWNALRVEKITRQQVYITNVIKRKLITAETSSTKPKAPVSRSEFDHWRELLLDELSLLPNCKYILVLGNYALTALTGEVGIDKHRGSIYHVTHRKRDFTVVVTYNPAYIAREPRRAITFQFDLNKLTRAIEGKIHAPEIVAKINPTYEEALAYLAYLRANPTYVAYDIETVGMETACIGFAHSNTEGMCINFRTTNTNVYSVVQEAELRRAIAETLADENIKFIAQNNSFDAGWLWFKDRVAVSPLWMDTMLAHHTLYPSLPHGLGYLTSQYTDYPYYKDELSEWKETGDIDGFWNYNVKDCVITRIAALKMLDELRDQKLDQFFFNHVMKLQPHLIKMQVGGLKADVQRKERIVEELAATVAAKRAMVIQAAQRATGKADYTLNPNSFHDLGALYFSELKLVGRGTSTDEENRKRMRAHPRTSEDARALLDAVDEYSAENKFYTTYANSRLDTDGRFRCEYKQTGVQSAPGRLSSSGTMWGNGLNLQNIPERAKDMFVADEGYNFVYFDAAQIEARFVACLAGIEVWLDQFERARQNPGTYDAHRALASVLYKVPYDDVPLVDWVADGQPTIRYIAKRCRHGLNYRMQAPRLAVTAGLTLRDAERNYALYHSEFPEIRKWWDDTMDEVRSTRQLWSPLGRRWILLERFDDTSVALDSIIAFKPQSTAGDHIASVIYKCERDPRWPKSARMMLNVHDADIAMCKPEDNETVAGLMKLYAEEPIMINGYAMSVPAEFGISQPDAEGVHRWSTIKKLKDRVVALPKL